MTLEELRKRLSEVDRELIGLVAARQRIVAEIGAHKIRNAVPTRDYEREREVLKGAQDQARALSLEPGLAGEIMERAIYYGALGPTTPQLELAARLARDLDDLGRRRATAP